MKLFSYLSKAAAALLLCVLVAAPRNGQAQSMLGIGLTQSIPDTVNSGDTVTFSFYVKNFNKQSPFSGSFVLNGGLLDSITGIHALIGINNFNYFIGAGDSIAYSFTVPIVGHSGSSTQGFKIGSNVVVVWPSILGTSSFITMDSLVHPLYVLPGVVQRPPASTGQRGSLSLYPNPAIDQIKLDVLAPGRTIEQVRVYDVTGRTLLLLSGETQHLDLSLLEPGMYFLEAFLTGSAKPEIYKIQKK